MINRRHVRLSTLPNIPSIPKSGRVSKPAFLRVSTVNAVYLSRASTTSLTQHHYGVNVLLSISAVISIFLVVAAGSITSHIQYDRLLPLIMRMSYQMVRYLMYHCVLYKLYRCFVVSWLPYRKRSLYMMVILLLLSSVLHFADSMLNLHPHSEFNQDLISAINSFSIPLTILITITFIVPFLRRLSRLTIGQTKDNRMATCALCNKRLSALEVTDNMIELELLLYTTKMTNIVVWCNSTCLCLEAIHWTDSLDAADRMTIVGVYSISIVILCLSIYFLCDVSKSQHNRCCVCCNYLWSQCCTAASKRAIDYEDGRFVRELCWILHGETCAELAEENEMSEIDVMKRQSSKMKLDHDGITMRRLTIPPPPPPGSPPVNPPEQSMGSMKSGKATANIKSEYAEITVRLWVGTAVDIYSPSKKEWVDGTIAEIQNDSIRIVYGKYMQWLKKDSPHFRPKFKVQTTKPVTASSASSENQPVVNRMASRSSFVALHPPKISISRDQLKGAPNRPEVNGMIMSSKMGTNRTMSQVPSSKSFSMKIEEPDAEMEMLEQWYKKDVEAPNCSKNDNMNTSNSKCREN